MSQHTAQLPWYAWNAAGRWLTFALAATSIACLLSEFYFPASMRPMTLYLLLPGMAVMGAWAVWDYWQSDGRLFRAVVIGSVAGLAAAFAYDIFRLPFVFAKPLGIASVVPPLPLFKVFPRFGAMILGQPMEQERYSLAAQLIGWAYHFSNGLTFGVMYLALVGNPTRHHWLWGAVFAVGLELGMLFTPYPALFKIHLGTAFIVATLAAHLIFGLVMGFLAQRMYARAVA